MRTSLHTIVKTPGSGGKRSTAQRPIRGFDDVMKLHAALVALFGKHGSQLVRTGLPGFVTREGDGEIPTIAFEIDDGKISAIYVVRTPDTLRHLH